MSFTLPAKGCETYSSIKKFGLCDDAPPAKNPAYIDEDDGRKWIAIVSNELMHEVTFTAIDNCIEEMRADGKMAKRCDGVLTYPSTIIFVELKERGALGPKWVKDAEDQLRITIDNFENTNPNLYIVKKAYIANNQHPEFKSSQMARMDKFTDEMGYELQIVNRIVLD
jgi:hypothetical protein